MRKGIIRDGTPGEPYPYGAAVHIPEILICESGDYVAGAGVRVVLNEGQLLFLASFEGTNIAHATPIEVILDAVGKYNRKFES